MSFQLLRETAIRWADDECHLAATAAAVSVPPKMSAQPSDQKIDQLEGMFSDLLKKFDRLLNERPRG